MGKYTVSRGEDVPDVAEIARLLDQNAFSPLPQAGDRKAWSAIAGRPWVKQWLPDLLEHAQKAADAGPTQVKATDHLAFFRTGFRDAHNASACRRGPLLSALLAAECLEYKGRFLDALLDLSWALAEETSWVMPPHMAAVGGQLLPDVAAPGIDLRVAGTASTLAEMVYLLGPEMDAVTPTWRKRILFEIERQAIGPYLSGGSWWEQALHNWNAVCNRGMVAAALLADFDTETSARVLHKALGSVRRFLSGFTSDGGCSEGPGYWAYGVSNYASLAYYVHCATGGEVDLLADPILKAVFAYPTGLILSGRKVANFADCSAEVGFRSGPVAWAAARLGVPSMEALASGGRGPKRFLTSILDVYLAPRAADFSPPGEFFLPDLMLLIARGAGADGEQLVLAAKGGHNNEHHNHNDVGAFIVHWRGESLICDLGAPNYTRTLFSPQRYELLGTRSLGHNVPLINGVEQGTGEQFRAADFRLEQQQGAIGVNMELAGAYPPEARLKSLRRSVILHRTGSEFIELTDAIEFASDACRYELPLYTAGLFETAGEGVVQARGDSASLRIEFDPGVAEAHIEKVEHGDARLAHYFGPELSRCTLKLRAEPRRATVRVRLIPAG